MPGIAEQVKGLISNAAVAAAMFDTEMRYLAWSQRWLDEYKLGPRDLSGLSHYEIFPEIGEEWKAVHRRCLRGAVEKRENDPFERPGAKLDYVRWSVQPWYDESGRIGGLVMFTEVVTEHQRVVNALRDSERRLSRIFRESPAPLAVSEFETGRFLDVNQAMLSVMRASSRDQMVGRTSVEIGMIAAADRARLAQMVSSKGSVEGFTTAMRRLDGEALLADLYSASYVEDGRRFLLTSLVDITARKRSEETITRLATAIDQALETVVITDAEGNILYANPAFERTTGYTVAEALGKNPRILKSGKHDASFYRQMWEVLAGGGVWHGRFQNKRKDGSFYWEDAAISPVRDEAGRIVNYIALKLDVTREADLQAQLAQAQKMESIGRLAGGVAHDFNNLLTVIAGYSKMALEELSPADPLRAYVVEIEKAADRAAALTRQLLAFSRKQVLLPRVLDLNHAVAGMQSMLERLVGEDVEVKLALAPGNLFVRADPHQLEQVIMNLAVNARDAMPRGGRLLIGTGFVERDESYAASHPEFRAGHYALLSMSDNGLGMDEATRRRIFEPFFTTKEVGQGTGLGLSTVQGIVAQSGGAINVYSEPGCGTTFTIYLPAVGEAAAEEAKPVPGHALRGNETILVVEDRAEVREYAVNALESYGYRVIQAAHAGEALSAWEREVSRIQLVLTDVVMPQTSGTELVAKLAKMKPGLKTLYMSGYAEEVMTNRGVLGEDCHFIQKPFSAEELARAVRAVLNPP